MTIRAHANAVLARLREDSVLSGVTFQGVVTDRPDRYVTMFMDSGDWTQQRLTGPQGTATFGMTFHSVGTTAEQAQFVAEHVFDKLLGYTPNVPARACWRIRHVSSQPVQLDQDVNPPLYYCVDVFNLTSDPA